MGAPSPILGQSLGRYRVLEQIGAGGMGLVFRAHDERLDRDVALKVLPPGTVSDEHARQRFHEEARALSKLNHPNIGTIHDFDTQDGIDFLVMELVPGVTLDERFKAGPLPEAEVCRLGVQLAEGLAAAHQQGVIHRDLKPGNLRLTPDDRLKILDFGLAKLLRPVTPDATTESLSQTHGAVGTLPYMAPEQLRGQPADARSDIWAAGCVLYEMATGRRPFQQKLSTALVDEIIHQAPPAPREVRGSVSGGLEAVILKALDKEPERRYQSARELAVDLRRVAAFASTAVVAVTPPTKKSWKLAAAVSFVLVLALVATVFIRQKRSERAGRGRPEIHSLAVLPLANMSGDPNQEYFSDGMTEQLITDLAKLGKFKVISRTSVLRYKGTTKPMVEIAKELGVDAVLEGSISRAGDRVKVSVQLIHGATDTHLWAESYERDLRDVFALQREISTASTRAIAGQSTAQAAARLPVRQRVAPEAYDAYLKGRYFANMWTPDGFAKCPVWFQKAILIEPTYAEAYGSLAECYAMAALFGVRAPGELMPKAKAAAEKAVSLDDSVGAGHAGLALVRLFYDWDLPAAEREFQRAIELDPSRSDTHVNHTIALTFAGRFDEAIAESKRSIELDPLALNPNLQLVWVYFYAGHYQDSIAQAQKTLELDPNYGLAYMELAWNHAALGSKEKAKQACRKALQLMPDEQVTMSSCAYVFGRVGARDEAARYQQKLLAMAKKVHVDPYNIGWAYAGTEDKHALDWFERAYAEHSASMSALGVEVLPDSIRSHPRFQALLRRINSPPAPTKQ